MEPDRRDDVRAELEEMDQPHPQMDGDANLVNEFDLLSLFDVGIESRSPGSLTPVAPSEANDTLIGLSSSPSHPVRRWLGGQPPLEEHRGMVCRHSLSFLTSGSHATSYYQTHSLQVSNNVCPYGPGAPGWTLAGVTLAGCLANTQTCLYQPPSITNYFNSNFSFTQDIRTLGDIPPAMLPVTALKMEKSSWYRSWREFIGDHDVLEQPASPPLDWKIFPRTSFLIPWNRLHKL